MGSGREGQQYDEGVDVVPEEYTRTVLRYSDHLHLGSEQTTHFRRTPDGYPGLRVAQTPHLDLGAQRFPAAADRKLPAPRDQRQIHQDQICNPVADADAAVCVLRQPAAVHQGALPPLPRKQHPRPLGFLRCTDADLFPAEIRMGCGIARARHRRNPASTFPLNPPLAKWDFYKPGCRCKSTSGRNKDGLRHRPVSSPEESGLAPAIRTKQKGTTCSVVPFYTPLRLPPSRQ